MFIKEVIDNLFVHPKSFPLVFLPELWSNESKGGFITDLGNNNSLITGSWHHRHKVDNKENLYKAVNYINSTKFSTNKDLLDYLKGKDSYLVKNDTKEK